MIFSANPGRSGSGYLARLLASTGVVDAGHERLPAMVHSWARWVYRSGLDASFEARRIKVEAIRRELAAMPDGYRYADTSHMFVKTFADVVFDAFDASEVSVVVLRRDLLAVVRSFFELDELGPVRQPWHDFMPSPTARAARFRLDASDVESHIDLILGCLVDNHSRYEDLRTAVPEAQWLRADLESITTESGAARLIRDLDLPLPGSLEAVVSERVNEKRTEKRQIGLTLSERRFNQHLVSFVDRFGQRSAVRRFLEHHDRDELL